MITFKTIKGNHIVTVNRKEYVFSDMRPAWVFIRLVHSRRVNESL